MLIDPSEFDIKLALHRLELARNWILEHAPENLRFKIMKTMPDGISQRLNQKQKHGLKILSEDLSSREFTSIELHNHVYAVAERSGQKSTELFKAIYLVMLDRESGPRVGNFISALDRDFVVSRLREASL